MAASALTIVSKVSGRLVLTSVIGPASQWPIRMTPYSPKTRAISSVSTGFGAGLVVLGAEEDGFGDSGSDGPLGPGIGMPGDSGVLGPPGPGMLGLDG
ncbi:hypothetical protein D5S17_28730 [Pseudonocardiaceae bacterium YIM PH 21723]|nr:hypothetical protein D5S17_28730 [Pseudonocardiaceae bacterium YIM PH 21723]